MTQTTYTMFVANEDGRDEIVARHVTAAQALSIAVGRGEGEARIVRWHDDTHRFYAIVRYPAGRPCEPVAAVRGPLSPDATADAGKAAWLFERTFLSEPRRFWEGEILPDDDYARRQHRKESAT